MSQTNTPSTDTIDPYINDDDSDEYNDEDNDEDNELTLEEIMVSIDELKLHFKSLANSCLTKQSGACDSCDRDLVQFFIKEEKRNKKCALLVELNERYILEKNTETKNKLKRVITTTTDSVKTDLLEMIEDTDCPEGQYLLHCQIAKEKYEMINDLIKMTNSADELTEL